MTHQRVAADYYPTPAGVTDGLVTILKQNNSLTSDHTILDPCAGHGAILSRFPSNRTIGNDPYPSLDFKPDYQMDATSSAFWETISDKGGYDWGITNTPYDNELMIPILERSISAARVGVAALVRLSFMEPTVKISNGFSREAYLRRHSDSLRFFIPVNPRPQFRKDTKGTDSSTVAWLVWLKAYSWQRSAGIENPFQFLNRW
jgi:hypothetical protein